MHSKFPRIFCWVISPVLFSTAVIANNASGPGGNEKMGKYYYGTDFGPLLVTVDTDGKCKMDNTVVSTYNLKHRTSGGSIFKFTCPENTYQYINGAYSPLNDAHYLGKIVFDLYQTWLHEPPIHSKLIMRVHYGKNYENAFWDGTRMTFGDGGSLFYPFVGPDDIGHEVSHGFTEQHSKLIYDGQPGGINESFSDMAGEATKYFLHNDKPESERNNWLCGADTIKGPPGTALRYFDDPTKDGYSIGSARNYYDGMDVHESSGVFNKAFYLLAHKPGWNVERAFITVATANQLYWNSDSGFDDAACGIAKAAKDLDYSVDDVIAAFNAVDVDASCNH